MPAERNPTKAEQAKYRRERKAAGICPKCDGKGAPHIDACTACQGTGYAKKKAPYVCYNCLNGLHIHSATPCHCKHRAHKKRKAKR